MTRYPLQRTQGLPARLQQIVEPYGSVTSLATAIGRSEGAVRKWLRGEAEPNATDLRLLSNATGASVEWLIFGGIPFSSSFLLEYLSYLAYRRDCRAMRRRPVVWTKLTAAEKEAFEGRARAELAAWALDNET